VSISKLNSSKNKARFLKYIIEGHTVERACRLVGIDQSTPYRWCYVSKEFKQKYDNAKAVKAKGYIEKGLDKLVSGAVEITEKTEVFTKDEDTGEYIKKSTTTKKLPPNIKALQLLASKYMPNEYKDNDTKEINITISQKDRALTIEDRLRILNDDAIEGECIELDSNDSNSLEGE